MAFDVSIPLIIGLVGVATAILERGYKTFLEAKKVDPALKFGAPYMLNLLISTGIGTALATTVIPTLVTQLQGDTETVIPVTVGSILLNFFLGYLSTFRILDAFNNSTDKKMAIAEAQTTTPPATTTTP